MQMSLSSLQLDAFFEVAQRSSFSDAAKALGITQSALSQRVLNLESDLETTLFIREHSGLKLTDAAQNLLRYCHTRVALEEGYLSSLKSRSSSELAGTVRIAGFSSVVRSLLLPALASTMRDNERLSLKLVTAELHQLLPLLQHAAVDYLITSERPDKEGIESTLLAFEENVLVKSKSYKGPEIYLDHDERDATTNAYLKLAGVRTQGIRRRYLDDVYGLIDGVRMGYGIAVLPRHLVDGKKEFSILRPSIRLGVPVYLAYYAQPYFTPLHHSLVKSITDHFKIFLVKPSPGKASP